MAAIATASLVSGIIAFILSNISFIPGIRMLSYLAFASGVLGVVWGLMSLRSCKRHARHTGRSIWGIVLSIFALVESVVSIIVTRSY